MANNKWLSDLKVLKSSTDTLRSHLRNGNVEASDNDTLQTLISKVPSLAPIEDSDKWQPDPLWKFPDPNGSGELKTIREIWDEDTTGTTYGTYRGIYQIIGEYDTLDLKKALNSRTQADTFILSDGTIYENITANTLEHTWDKSKDVIDSKGRPMRYVRVYSKTAVGYLLPFNRTTIWCIHDMDNGSTSTTNSECSYMPCECIELGSKKTSISSYTMPYALKKLVFDGASANGTNPSTLPNLREIEIKSTKQLTLSVNSNTYGFAKINIKNLKIEDPSIYNVSSVSLDGYSVIGIMCIDNIDFSNLPAKVTTCTLKQISSYSIQLPPYITTFTGSYIYNCEELTLPETIKTVSISYLTNLKKLVIVGNPSTCSLSSMNSLKELILPFDFNATGINLSSSTFMEHDSLVDILENLADLTGQSAKTITFGSTNLAKLTAEEKAIATNKNWTLS